MKHKEETKKHGARGLRDSALEALTGSNERHHQHTRPGPDAGLPCCCICLLSIGTIPPGGLWCDVRDRERSEGVKPRRAEAEAAS